MNCRRFWFAMTVSLALGACGGSSHPADSGAGRSMTPTEAREFVAETQRQRGVRTQHPPVTNMDELLEVLATDQIGRFGDAEQLVAGKPGVDALTLHATLELCWSDAFSTLSLIMDELRKRSDSNVRRLNKKRDSGQTLGDAETKSLAQSEKDMEFDIKAKLALDVLAREHLQTASPIVDEARRQFAQQKPVYMVTAYRSVLTGSWRHFDEAMNGLVDDERTQAPLVYLRALEQLKRYGVRKDTRALLREALRLNPKMVRAQAKLVLTEEGVDANYAELEQLRAMAPEHPIVAFAGPSIQSDYELSSSFRKAMDARQPAGTEPAPAAPPPPASP